jgi:hypothetical protein
MHAIVHRDYRWQAKNEKEKPTESKEETKKEEET